MITENDGYNFALGFCKYAARLVIIGLIGGAAMWVGISIFGVGVDSTDESGWHRSGLRVHKDALTGIEYLSDGKGGLVRREFR